MTLTDGERTFEVYFNTYYEDGSWWCECTVDLLNASSMPCFEAEDYDPELPLKDSALIHITDDIDSLIDYCNEWQDNTGDFRDDSLPSGQKCAEMVDVTNTYAKAVNALFSTHSKEEPSKQRRW